MKRILTLVLAITSVAAFAQQNVKSEKVKNPKTMKTASGLEYTITTKGNGKKPENGDKVKVHYTGKLLNDTVFDSSVSRGQPFEFKLGAGQVIKGWDEAFLLLQVGDKATIKLPPSIAYGEQANGKIPANSTLIFDIELLDVTPGLRQWDAKGKEKDTIKTASGLKYIMFERKDGLPCAGAKATVHYSGFFKDGKMFDSSVERGKPFTVKVGANQVIKGWDEGLALLHKGEKAKFIIPYDLAYGEKGYGPIPAKADLIFDVEIVDVTPVVAPLKYDITGKEEKTTQSGIKYYVINKSNNPVKAEAGKTVKVHYSGYLADGKMFDSSVERGDPIEFPLGKGQVIPGWEEGIALMNIGDKIRLVIPYFLAYGEQGRAPVIPPKADLTFDVELIDVK
ncbi:MAG: FKBP-type peptidyl-prolyl cis-trans isomerase [Bacteroidota bacterium]